MQLLAKVIKSYNKDTKHFLKKLCSITDGIITCAVHVVGFYFKTMHEESLPTHPQKKWKVKKKNVSKYTLIDLADLVTENVFEFG